MNFYGIPPSFKGCPIYHLTFDRMRILIGKELWLYRGNPFYRKVNWDPGKGVMWPKSPRVGVPATTRTQAAKPECLVLPPSQPWRALAASSACYRSRPVWPEALEDPLRDGRHYAAGVTRSSKSSNRCAQEFHGALLHNAQRRCG